MLCKKYYIVIANLNSSLSTRRSLVFYPPFKNKQYEGLTIALNICIAAFISTLNSTNLSREPIDIQLNLIKQPATLTLVYIVIPQYNSVLHLDCLLKKQIMRNIDASLWKNPDHPHALYFNNPHLDDLPYILDLKN